MVVDLKKERKHAVEAGRIDSAQAFLQRPFVYRGVIYWYYRHNYLQYVNCLKRTQHYSQRRLLLDANKMAKSIADGETVRPPAKDYTDNIDKMGSGSDHLD